MFSNRALRQMTVPLFFEQLLVMFVGIADTLVVSYAGEAAISGVSLVNQFNTIFIYLFTALASGGAVVISQYIGKRALERASEAASQLLLFSAIFSVVLSVGVFIGNAHLLKLMFGRVESDVMASCITYLRISAYSYPALAIYNASAALVRSMGRTSITRKREVFYGWRWIFQWNHTLMKHILGIAIPNGFENGVFQLVKVALSSIVALFGTYQIAANGVAQSIWSLAALAGTAMGPVFITVIFYSVEFIYFSFNAGYSQILCTGSRNETLCDLVGIDS